MNFNNYNKMKILKRRTVTPTLKEDCIGPCNNNMIKLGLCKCEKNEKTKMKKNKKNPFFEYRFWITAMIILCLSSLLFKISAITGLTIILVTWIYFKYFKK